VSAEAPPGFAQHIYRCSFAAPYSIERVVLQALHKESAQEGIFVQGHKNSAFALALHKKSPLHKNYKVCTKIANGYNPTRRKG
jgi:hypothetical protein